MEWYGDRVLAKVTQACQRALIQSTEEVRNEAIRLILDTPHTGRTYRRRSVEHVASAPGEPPASDTGTLTSRIDTVYDMANLSSLVQARIDYALYLEYGTQRMAPRPFLRPALANKRHETLGRFTTAIRMVLR